MPPPKQARRPAPARKVGRPKTDVPKVSIASIKGTPAYAAWLDGLAKHARLPVAILIEHALFEYAAAHGYASEQPNRV